MTGNPRVTPALQVVFAAVIFGSSGAFIRYLSLPPATISFFRMAVPALVLLIYFGVTGSFVILKASRLILLASFLNGIRILLYYMGYTYTTIGNAVVVLYTWPVFAGILSILFLKEKITRMKMVTLGLAFSGIVLVYSGSEFSFGSDDFLGITAMILSAAIYASTVIIFKFTSGKYTALETTLFQNLLGALMFLPAFVAIRPFPSAGQFTVAIAYAALVGLFGFTLFFTALRRIPASTASHLTYMEVPSAVCFGFFLFGEEVTVQMIAGGLMILISVILMRRHSRV